MNFKMLKAFGMSTALERHWYKLLKRRHKAELCHGWAATHPFTDKLCTNHQLRATLLCV